MRLGKKTAAVHCIHRKAGKHSASAMPWHGIHAQSRPMALPTKNPPDTPMPKELPRPLRWLLTVFALLCLVLGIVGIFLPGLPTTVFILLAAWAAARSSPRLYRWLWLHPLFGPMLRNWASGGRVSRRSKWSATVMMAVSGTILAFTEAPRWAVALACICMACVLAWLWRRPEPTDKRT